MGSVAATDLVKLALAVLQTGAARDPRQSVKLLARFALLQTLAGFCGISALGCASGALMIYATPILGGVGVLLAGAGAFVAIALAALGLAERTEKVRSRSPAVAAGGDASLAAAASLFNQHKGVVLTAALLAGVLVGGERSSPQR